VFESVVHLAFAPAPIAIAPVFPVTVVGDPLSGKPSSQSIETPHDTPIRCSCSRSGSLLPDSKRGGKGQSIVEICQEFVDKAKSEGNDEAVREWTKKLEQAKELQSGRYEKKQKKQKALVKRFLEIEDEMDEIEEAYGDRDKGVGFKWPETEEADEARKRYRRLKREHALLDKKIDWTDVEED